MADLRHLLAIYVHAHQAGNSVPPHIDAEARAALAVEPPAPGPTTDDIWELCEDHEFHLGDGFDGEASAEIMLQIIRVALTRWGRPAPAEPDTDAVLALAAIIRRVNGWHSLGAAALAEAILSHPGVSFSVLPPASGPVIPLDLDALLSPEGAYEPGTGQEDGAQLVDQVQWWAPLHGCETLENLLDRIRGRILPHLRPPIAGIDVPGPDGDYGGLQELCEAEGVDVRIGAPLLKRAREAWGATQPPAPAPAADGAARLRHCPTHGRQPANAWACPECLRELREELSRLKAPAADGERDHVPGVRNMVAADGEREELARLLDGDAKHLIEVALARECGKTWELGCRVARAAALLRKLPPEGLDPASYDAGGFVQIQRANQNPEAWAIRCGVSCMSTTGEWDIEPMPSDRTDEWLANHRWPSAAAAWAALQQARRQEVGDE